MTPPPLAAGSDFQGLLGSQLLQVSAVIKGLLMLRDGSSVASRLICVGPVLGMFCPEGPWSGTKATLLPL